MSRIGKRPVTIPAGVTLTVAGSTITVKGPKGELKRTLSPESATSSRATEFTVTRPSEAKKHKALHGLTPHAGRQHGRGRDQGLREDARDPGRRLQGRDEAVRGQPDRRLSPTRSPYKAPEGIKITVENNTTVKIEGADKENVGQVAAEIRSVRKPEPYKGKGIRYQGEQVRRKAGKTGAK